VDLVGVPLAFSSRPAFSGLLYGIYSVLVILGVRAWWLRARTPRTRPDSWKERQHDLVRD
jgi:nicotinamide mononucleotide transporter